jgi:membrane protease YdiL (CAAX protease family)
MTVTDVTMREQEPHKIVLQDQIETPPTALNTPLRLAGLLIVFAVAILPLMLASLLVLFRLYIPSSSLEVRYHYVNGLLMESSSLALLWYVLRQNHQRFSDLGLSFRFADLGHALLLIFGSGICYRLSYLSIMRIYNLIVGGGPAPPFVPASTLGISLFTLIFVVVNPAFEELIVRAFITTEISALTGKSFFAVVVSVTLQTAYHLYQGVPYALALGTVFLVFSIYYLRTRRILPVILAHLWFDLSALVLFPLLRLSRS